jgi:hypothetical protein
LQGNGTYRIHAIAYDKEGNRVKLGIKTIACDNAHSIKPFGTMDLPGQGGIVSGSSYVNFGWALTPQPKMIPTDGSTIWVIIDGVLLGHPVYNNYRADIATLFPGYANSSGAIGYYYVDTTKYANGVHTMGWFVTDNNGSEDGLGSRFISVLNMGTGISADPRIVSSFNLDLQNKGGYASSILDIVNIPLNYFSPVYLRRGYRPDSLPDSIYPDANGVINIEAHEIDRIELVLDQDGLDESRLGQKGNIERISKSIKKKFYGYLVVGDELRPLPLGSTLDTTYGIFYWQLGPGFVGKYQLVFVYEAGNDSIIKKNVMIDILPKYTIQK